MKKIDKRFGVIAAEKGFITLEQIVEAMRIQIGDELNQGKYRLIGEILQDRGYMTAKQINEVLKSMGIPFFES